MPTIKSLPGTGKVFRFKYDNNSLTGLAVKLDEQAYLLRAEARELHQHSLDFNARLNNFIRYSEGALREYARRSDKKRKAEDIGDRKSVPDFLESEPDYIHSPKGELKGGINYARR